MNELEYLRGLVAKFDAHYFNKYFGFTLKDIALRSGLQRQDLSKILKGKCRLPVKHMEAFIQAFKDLNIEEKSKDFKETEGQTWQRAHWAKMRNNLTTILLCANILSMNTYCREYILCRRANSPKGLLSFNTKPIVNSAKMLAIGIFLTIYTAICKTSSSIFLSPKLHYERV